MLQSFRNAAQSKFAQLVLALIALPFALWGVESYISTDTSVDKIATVGKLQISTQEFNQAVQNQLDRFRQQFGNNIDAGIMDSPEMRKSILDSLIDQRVVSRAVKTEQLVVSDTSLRDGIMADPNFQVGGKFSIEIYDQLLKAQGYTQASFENLLRDDLQKKHYQESISGTAFVSSTSLQQQLSAAEQSREIAVINFSPEQYQAQVQVTPAQIKTYYEQKKADFTIPEQVRAEYIELSIDALAPQMQVSPEELKAYYDTNSARYMQKEERKASHILINAAAKASDTDKKSAKAKADALFAQVKQNPGGFADLAKKNSQDPGSAASGGDLGFFKRGAMVKPFEDAAFAAKKGDIVGPILSDFGYHIIMLTDIRPEKGKTLAEVTPEIEGELKKQKAQKSFAELAEKFSNTVYEQSTSLKAAADAVKLPIRQSPFMSRGALLTPFNNAKLMAALFSDDVMKNKRNTEAVETATNVLVAARLLESKPSVLRPLAEVEKEISARIVREEATRLAVKAGEAALKQIQAGKPIEQKWPSLLAVSRNASGGLAPNIIDTAMKANAKTLPAYAGVENPGNGYTLIQVAKLLEPAAADAEKTKAFRQRLAQSIAQQELQSSLVALRSKTDVSIDEVKLAKKIE